MVEIKDLNARQKRAVLHDTGPALVVAGAGTGKTAVISMRIAYLIQNRMVPSSSILAVTFTEKAVAEMQERVDKLLPLGYADTHILTFHGLGDQILREFCFELGLSSDFVVMSQFQQIVVMQQVVESLQLKYYSSLSNPHGFVRALLQFVSRLKDENITSTDFARFVAERKAVEEEAEFTRLQELSTIYSAYQKQCLQQNMIDFGDQIILVIQLLENFPKIAEITQETYRYILVDEYQDTNFAQNYLLKLLSKKHHNLMVVGDDDQSIYGFRGAAIANILSFVRDFPESKQIVLTQNYRSAQALLDSSYALIQNNNPYRLEIENKIDKRLIGTKSKSSLKVSGLATYSEEMAALADWVEDMHDTYKIDYTQMAILLRKNNQATAVAQALQKKNIPFVIAESQDLLEQAEIKVLLNFVRVLNDNTDSQALYGLLASDLFQIPLDMIVVSSAQAAREHVSLEDYLRSSELTDKDEKYTEVLTLIDEFRAMAQSGSAGQLLYQFLDRSGYIRRLAQISETNSHAVTQLQNISQFFSVVKEFELASIDSHVYALWSYMREIEASGSEIMMQTSPLDVNAVQIMTIHKAKGLEFEAVALVDLTEQTFPARRMSDKIRLPEGLLQVSEEGIDWHIYEERRLFYVAMSRAKHHLWFSMSFDHGKKRIKKPSRFVHEASDQNLQVPEGSVSSSLKNIEQFETLPQLVHDPLSQFITPDGWLHLTTNQIADYLRSPKEFWYFSVLNLPKGPFHALVYGSAIHAALELYYKARVSGNKIVLQELLAAFETTWKSEGFVSLQHEKERFEQGKTTLKRFYVREQARDDIPQYVEKPFTLRVPDLKLVINGRYDAVFERNDKIEVRDFKTSEVDTQKGADRRLKESIQMSIYALAWEKTHSTPVDSVSLYFIESDILALNHSINHNKTLLNLKKVCEGIRKKQFSDKGASQIAFEKLL